MRNRTKQKKYKIKLDENDQPMRDNSNSLKQYGVKILQAQVTEIDWEKSFDVRLNLQKEQVALTQLERASAEKEIYRLQNEQAYAEAEKAKERGVLEKKQIQETIAAETKAKVAEFSLIEQKKLYEVEIYKAKTKKTAADAQYYENHKLVAAGLTPQEKEKFRNERVIGISANLSKIQFPANYWNNSGGGSGNGQGGTMLYDLLGADYAKKMLKE